MKIFVLTFGLPKPDRDAGAQRLCALLKMMAKRHQVDLCLVNEEPPASPQDPLHHYHCLLEDIGVHLLPGSWKSNQAVLRSERYDLGFFEHYHPAYMYASKFRWLQPQAKVIVDTVDVGFARAQAGAGIGVHSPIAVARDRWRELAAYRAADGVIAVTELDKDVLAHEGKMPPLFVLPIIRDTRPRPVQARKLELLFIGGFNHTPNLDGLRWFMQAVWPGVRDAVPDAVCTIIGSNAPQEALDFALLPGVSVKGYVPDVTPYLDRAAVSIAPLRFGGGMKGKVIEAMACGLPVVTTSAGAQGLSAVSGEHLCICDDPQAFQQAVTFLLQNAAQAQAMGLAGQRLADGLCSSSVVEQSVEQMLAALSAKPGAGVSPLGMRLHSLIFQVRWALAVRPRGLMEKFGCVPR